MSAINARHRGQILRIKKTLDFISQHPDGVTADDLKAAGLSCYGISKLMQLEQITAEEIKDPHRGPRCYHYLFKLRRVDA